MASGPLPEARPTPVALMPDGAGSATAQAPVFTGRIRAFGVRQHLRLMRRRAAAGQAPVLRQALEALALMVLRGLGPGYYQECGLWQHGLSWRHKLAHPSPRRYAQTLERLNPTAYRKVFQHKLYEKATLQMLGVPTAPFLGYAHSQRGYCDGGGALRRVADLERLLTARLGGKLCFKPLQGWGGQGFRAVEVLRRGQGIGLRPLDGEQVYGLDAYWRDVLGMEHGGEWLVEQYLEQHPGFVRFNPSSLNTVRMVMARRVCGEVCTLGAYLRIGKRGALVDNISAGGVIVSIDITTGTLVRLRESRPDFDPRDDHPETGMMLKGQVLHGWADIRALAERAMARIPNLRFAEFDIGMTQRGPVVVELNPDTAQDWLVDLIPLPEHFPLEAL